VWHHTVRLHLSDDRRGGQELLIVHKGGQHVAPCDGQKIR
jgi:hypothetical protein